MPDEARLGAIGAADDLTNEWFVDERIHIGARCSGAMERLLTLAVAWATERVQFGQPDLRLPGRQLPARRIRRPTPPRPACSPARRAWLADTGADRKVVHAKASLAKLFASEAAFRCADRVVQVFGGRGYMRENAAERYLRELRVDRIWEGTSEIQRLIIARARWSGEASTGSSDDGAGRAPAAPLRPRPAAALRAALDRRRRGITAVRHRDDGPRQHRARRRAATRATSSTRSTPRSTATRCYPDLASLPEVPDTVVLRCQPAARGRRSRARPRPPACRTVVIPGGGVVEGGEAAAAMQAEVRRIGLETGTAHPRSELHGHGRPPRPERDVHRRPPPVAAAAAAMAGIAQSGSVSDAFVHAGPRIGWSRIVSCGSEVVLDVCDYLAACLDDPVTQSVVLFVEGFKRPERFLALADRALAMDVPILAVKVGRSQPGAGGGRRPFRVARRRGPRRRCRAARRRGDPVRRSRRAARGGRAREPAPAAGAVAWGAAGRAS